MKAGLAILLGYDVCSTICHHARVTDASPLLWVQGDHAAPRVEALQALQAVQQHVRLAGTAYRSQLIQPRVSRYGCYTYMHTINHQRGSSYSRCAGKGRVQLLLGHPRLPVCIVPPLNTCMLPLLAGTVCPQGTRYGAWPAERGYHHCSKQLLEGCGVSLADAMAFGGPSNQRHARCIACGDPRPVTARAESCMSDMTVCAASGTLGC